MYNTLKYIFDFCVALVVFILISWLLIPCMIILLLTGEHEIFYTQTRVGYKNKFFKIIKFATMLKNSPNMGTGSLTVRGDARVLPFGKFLRKTKINELPQIFNIFNGTMSLVGPRPQMEIDFYRFPKHVQKVIYNSRPGITGIGSIIFRDEEFYMSQDGVDPIEFYENKISPYKGELEIWYQNNASLWVDFQLLFLTAWVIISPESKLPYKCFKNIPARPDWMIK